MIYFWRVVALGIVCAAADGGADLELISDEQIAVLVGELASTNKPPDTAKGLAKDASGHDTEAQKKVLRAFRQLRGLAPRSFPFLFDHVDDEPYSLTMTSQGVARNYSVGEVCREIMASNLQPAVCRPNAPSTDAKRRPSPPDYLAHYKLFQPDAANEWWKSHENKSLRELQIEVLEWTLIEETRASRKYSEADRDGIRKALRRLRATKDPFEPGPPFSG